MEKSKYKIKNTLGMFDLLKGAVMFSMIIGHTYGLNDNYQNSVITLILTGIMTFFGEAAMPALLIVSGYGFRKTTTGKCLHRLFKTLLIPFFVTVVLTAAVHLVTRTIFYGSFIYQIKESLKIFLGGLLGVTQTVSIAGHDVYDCGPIWFMMALVVSSLLFNELLKCFEGKYLFIASLIISCVGWVLSLGPGLPLTFSQGLVATLYICIGYMAKKEKFFVSFSDAKKMVKIIVPTIIVYLLFKGAGGTFYMAHNTYSYGPIAIFVNALVATLIIIGFLHLNRFSGRISDVFRNVGRNSLYVLCAHSIEYIAIGSRLQVEFADGWEGQVWLRNLIIISIRIIIDFILAYGYVEVKKILSKKLEGVKDFKLFGGFIYGR